MRYIRLQSTATLLCLFCATVAYAQPSQPAAVPKLVRFSGSFRPANGTPPQTMESVTLSVYRDQTGGEALWHEVQNVVVDADGYYSVLMGATKNEGMPVDLFTSGEPRWLGVQFNRPGESEQPRTLLVSVPYALKSVDADTLGGKPASAYLLAAPEASTPAAGVNAASVAGVPAGTTRNPATMAKPKATPANSGQPNYIGKFTNTTDLIDSAMYEVNGNVGIFTTTPAISLDVRTGSLPQMGIAGKTDYLTFFASDKYGPAIYWDPALDMRFGKGGTGLYNPFGFTEYMRIQSSTGNVGIGTITPVARLDVETATGPAIIGNTTDPSGMFAGIFGYGSGVNGAGVAGFSKAAAGGYGGYFQSNATSGKGFGLLGQTASPIDGSIGVSGWAQAATGQVFGVSGNASSSTNNAAGVNGFEGASTGQVYGVNGTTASTGQYSAGVNGFEGATTGQVFGVAGGTNSTSQGSAAVYGYEGATTGLVFGVVGGISSTTNGAAGVSGNERATTGQVFGVSGGTESTSNGAAGVYGHAGAATGQVFGVSGGTASTGSGAAGVNGFEEATTGQVYGVAGNTNSATDGAAGMWAYEGAATGQVYGLVAHAQSTSGVAIFGHATATSGSTVGVGGWTDSATGVGGQFVNTSGSGLVLFGGSGGPSPTTIFTVDAGGNGFFAGNLNVTGNLTKGSGSFKIDHPLDPENKYLSHSFVESPDMMNVYNGMAKLDAKGEAWVNLPDYFEALNGDFRYQLTSIGAPAPRLYVAQEVSQNRFKIAGGHAGGRVSWQVTGIRHDAYASAHRIPVAEDKPPTEQGRYLHPDVYRQGENRQVGVTRR